MVPAEQVQQTVDAQERELGRLGVAVLGGLAEDGRPGDGKVAEVIAVPGERKHIRGVVVAGKLSVEPPELAIRRDPHRNGRCRPRESCLDLGKAYGANERLPDDFGRHLRANSFDHLDLEWGHGHK